MFLPEYMQNKTLTEKDGNEAEVNLQNQMH